MASHCSERYRMYEKCRRDRLNLALDSIQEALIKSIKHELRCIFNSKRRLAVQKQNFPYLDSQSGAGKKWSKIEIASRTVDFLHFHAQRSRQHRHKYLTLAQRVKSAPPVESQRKKPRQPKRVSFNSKCYVLVPVGSDDASKSVSAIQETVRDTLSTEKSKEKREISHSIEYLCQDDSPKGPSRRDEPRSSIETKTKQHSDASQQSVSIFKVPTSGVAVQRPRRDSGCEPIASATTTCSDVLRDFPKLPNVTVKVLHVPPAVSLSQVTKLDRPATKSSCSTNSDSNKSVSNNSISDTSSSKANAKDDSMEVAADSVEPPAKKLSTQSGAYASQKEIMIDLVSPSPPADDGLSSPLTNSIRHCPPLTGQTVNVKSMASDTCNVDVNLIRTFNDESLPAHDKLSQEHDNQLTDSLSSAKSLRRKSVEVVERSPRHLGQQIGVIRSQGLPTGLEPTFPISLSGGQLNQQNSSLLSNTMDFKLPNSVGHQRDSFTCMSNESTVAAAGSSADLYKSVKSSNAGGPTNAQKCLSSDSRRVRSKNCSSAQSGHLGLPSESVSNCETSYMTFGEQQETMAQSSVSVDVDDFNQQLIESRSSQTSSSASASVMPGTEHTAFLHSHQRPYSISDSESLTVSTTTASQLYARAGESLPPHDTKRQVNMDCKSIEMDMQQVEMHKFNSISSSNQSTRQGHRNDQTAVVPSMAVSSERTPVKHISHFHQIYSNQQQSLNMSQSLAFPPVHHEYHDERLRYFSLASSNVDGKVADGINGKYTSSYVDPTPSAANNVMDDEILDTLMMEDPLSAEIINHDISLEGSSLLQSLECTPKRELSSASSVYHAEHSRRKKTATDSSSSTSNVAGGSTYGSTWHNVESMVGPPADQRWFTHPSSRGDYADGSYFQYSSLVPTKLFGEPHHQMASSDPQQQQHQQSTYFYGSTDSNDHFGRQQGAAKFGGHKLPSAMFSNFNLSTILPEMSHRSSGGIMKM